CSRGGPGPATRVAEETGETLRNHHTEASQLPSDAVDPDPRAEGLRVEDPAREVARAAVLEDQAVLRAGDRADGPVHEIAGRRGGSLEILGRVVLVHAHGVL